MTLSIVKNNFRTLQAKHTDTSKNTLPVYTKNKLIDYMRHLKYLSCNSDPKTGRSYILPKIHKQGNAGRPINNHPTERISEVVDYHLRPLVQTLPCLHKRYYTLASGTSTGQWPPHDPGCFLSISNIPHNEGIKACRHFLNTRQNIHFLLNTNAISSE